MLEGRQTGKRPISSGNFKVLSEIFADGVKIFAVVERQEILAVLFPIKFDVLVVHYYILIRFIPEINHKGKIIFVKIVLFIK